ncbi:MAG: translation initiation factor IF-2, partial [Cyanobacteriota bacterium]
MSRDLGLDNKDVLDAAEKLAIAARSHSSSISDEEAARIRALIKGQPTPSSSAPATPAKTILSVKKAPSQPTPPQPAPAPPTAPHATPAPPPATPAAPPPPPPPASGARPAPPTPRPQRPGAPPPGRQGAKPNAGPGGRSGAGPTRGSTPLELFGKPIRRDGSAAGPSTPG